MNLHRFLILGAAVGALAACSSDNTSPKLVTPGPHALIHIINAVPDTGALDFRFIDTIDGVPNVEFVNLPFRGGTDRGYQSVSTGSHHIRVFMDASNLNAAGLTNDPAIVSDGDGRHDVHVCGWCSLHVHLLRQRSGQGSEVPDSDRRLRDPEDGVLGRACHQHEHQRGELLPYQWHGGAHDRRRPNRRWYRCFRLHTAPIRY